MRIDSWPMDRIMQLPDCCFGRRWSVISGRNIAAASTEQWISGMAVPDKIVVWEVVFWNSAIIESQMWLKIAIGDHEPGSDAEFDAFERLFKGDLDNAVEEGVLYSGRRQVLVLSMRMPVAMQGRRFAFQYHNHHATYSLEMNVALEISSVPTEVPDWMISGLAKSL